jgi:hypothetical protein
VLVKHVCHTLLIHEKYSIFLFKILFDINFFKKNKPILPLGLGLTRLFSIYSRQDFWIQKNKKYSRQDFKNKISFQIKQAF